MIASKRRDGKFIHCDYKADMQQIIIAHVLFCCLVSLHVVYSTGHCLQSEQGIQYFVPRFDSPTKFDYGVRVMILKPSWMDIQCY